MSVLPEIERAIAGAGCLAAWASPLPLRKSRRPTVGSQYLDAAGLATRLGVTESWVVKHTRRSYTRYPIPCIRFGRSIRYDWNSEELQKWIKRSRQ